MALKSLGVVGSKSYITQTPIVGYTLQLLFDEIFCKVRGVARKGFQATGGHPKGGRPFIPCPHN